MRAGRPQVRTEVCKQMASEDMLGLRSTTALGPSETPIHAPAMATMQSQGTNGGDGRRLEEGKRVFHYKQTIHFSKDTDMASAGPRRRQIRRRHRPKTSSTTSFAINHFVIFLLDFLCPHHQASLFPLAEAAVVCTTNRDCRNLVHPSSKCSSKTWACTNPFASGCLRTLLGSDIFPNKRVCNSDDGTDPDPSVCDLPDPNFNYTEVRIAPGNWESTMFNGYILQILLSELLGVPTTLETGDDIVVDDSTNTGQVQAGRLMSFYDPANGFPYPSRAYQFDSLEVANAHGGDCIAARRQSTDPKPCAHLIPEVSLW